MNLKHSRKEVIMKGRAKVRQKYKRLYKCILLTGVDICGDFTPKKKVDLAHFTENYQHPTFKETTSTPYPAIPALTTTYKLTQVVDKTNGENPPGYCINNTIKGSSKVRQ